MAQTKFEHLSTWSKASVIIKKLESLPKDELENVLKLVKQGLNLKD